MVFDEDYDGARWTYGLLFRPLGFAQVPEGWVIKSDRKHEDFPNHGTVDYPRQLTDQEVESFQLTPLREDWVKESAMPDNSELANTKAGLKVANTILEQLGNARFRTMTGAKNIVALEDGIQFSIPKAKDGINKVVIKLNPQDNYDIEYWRIRGATFKKVKESKNIGVGNLGSVFTKDTGLAISLGTMGRKEPLGRRRGL